MKAIDNETITRNKLKTIMLSIQLKI